SNDKITTLPVRPTPPSPNRTPTLYDYPLDSGGDSSGEDLSETAESLHTQTALTLVVHLPPMGLIPTSPAYIQIALTTPSPLVSSSPLPSPPTTIVPPPPEHIESIGDDIETLHASLASAMQETMTLRARVGSLDQHDVVTRESLKIARGRITRSQLRAEYAEQEVKELHEFRVTNRFEMAELRSREQDT
ncbi:hypothetical protein Tco_0853960, partial [Tanacetum coccineum]